MSETTTLSLPKSLPYPLTVTAVLIRPDFFVKKHALLFKYRFYENVVVPTEKLDPEEVEKYKYEPKIIKLEVIGTFESPIEGDVVSVSLKVGDVVENPVPVARIREPCTHLVQFNGLCGICGANLADETDYNAYDIKERAPIKMSHQTSQLTVSYEEAARIEKSTRDVLLEEKKLILVVDLDQTVIQTTTDPTVYLWQQDPENPNYNAVKDVHSFSLEERIQNGKKNGSEKKKSWYYVKIRPGLAEFLEAVSPKYEMHIYTMATRDYAKEIAKIIDPTEKYFGDRILSRDESGSSSIKSLARLFPTNTLMVVVIDDRDDVWQWLPNLIKVVPYDFFIGIGDINSNFLPKQTNLVRPTKRGIVGEIEKEMGEEEKAEKAAEEARQLEIQKEEAKRMEEEAKKEEAKDVSEDSDSDTLSDSDSESESSSKDTTPPEDTLLKIQSAKREEYLKKLETERPLAKLQETLDRKLEDSGKKVEHTLLSDDDEELPYLTKILLDVNARFYELHDSGLPADIKDLMPEMKKKVLGRTCLVFTGMFPINATRGEPSIITWARSFGARIESKISRHITHLILYEAKTAKVRLAKTLYGDKVKVVHPNWLFACFQRWEKVDESEFEIMFDPNDVVADRNLEKLKEELYEPDNEELAKKFDGLDFQALGGELDEFLSSDDDLSEDEVEENKLKRSLDEQEDSVIKKRKIEENGTANENDDDEIFDDDDFEKAMGELEDDIDSES